jgi:signal transduction histidine kinase
MALSPAHLRRLVRRDMTVVAAVLATVLGFTLVVPEAQIAVDSPSARIAVEMLRLCAVGFAAVILGLPYQQHHSVVRNAFVAALAVIAASSAALGIVPRVLTEVTGIEWDPELGFYPWLTSRYLAGLLFVCAGLEWPRLSQRAFVLVGLGALALVDGILITANLPTRLGVAAGGVDAGMNLSWLVSLEVPPLLLFALGAWLAARLAVRSGAPLERWLALSLLVGVFTQIQAIRQPELLNSTVTTTDLLRTLSTGLLLVGAALQVHQLSRNRAAVLRLQRRDLQERDDMVNTLSSYVAREEAFRSVVTHELATPVATIQAYAHVLRRSEVDERWHGALDGLVNEAEQLHALIGRVDEMRALEGDDFSCNLRPVRALPLLRDLARFANALPGDHEVAVRAADLRISADPVRLGQALRNVVTNAIRYSPEGGQIDIVGEAVEHDRYRITLADQGVGIAAADGELLLAFAQRGDNVDGVEGSGIGLYVTRRIVDAHGGHLEITANEPVGTRVIIEVARP